MNTMENEVTPNQEINLVENEATLNQDVNTTKDETTLTEELIQTEVNSTKTDVDMSTSVEAKEETKKEKTKQNTIEQRKNIVQQLDQLYNNQDSDLSETIVKFRKIQTEWKALSSENPTEESQETWKSYNNFQDKFYDLSKINRELIEYNFKKNLELKKQLCVKAEQFLELEDVSKALRSLQSLHKEWREIGSVSKEVSEEIWEKFKSISDQINSKYTDVLNSNKERNEMIANTKTVWCEEIENIDLTTMISYKDWETAADRIKEINKLFSADNISDHKLNQQLYKKLRTACDNFFEQKSKFYAGKKEEMQANLEKKILLLAKAEELKNNTDWKDTANKIIELQKEWKTIGPTNHKNSKSTWEQFIAACDYFFEQKNKQFASKKDEEKDNFQLKKDIIEKIEKYELSENESENFDILKAFYKEFNEIGHVPFKEKDKVYNQFKDACDKQYDKIKIKFHIAGRTYGNNRTTLLKKHEQLKAEIATYENNIGFFSTSKKSSTIVKDMQRKINNLKVELTVILDQLNQIDAK